MRMHPLFASLDNEPLDAVLHGIGDAVCVTNRDMVFQAVNLRFAQFYGLQDPSVLLGKTALEVYPAFKQSVFYEACARTAQTGETTTRFGYSANTKSWVVIRCYKFGEDRYAMVVHQVTDDTSKAGYAPHYDTLTSLPNRWAFEGDAETLHQHLQAAGLMLIDISHFKNINESLGFHAGDRCLMEVAARIKQAALANDRVYRVGNDQFLVMGAAAPEDMTNRREHVTCVLGEPIVLSGKEYVLQFNIGVSVTTNQLAGADALTHAERALNYAKTHKTGYAEYADGLGGTSYDPHLTKGIKDAIANDELVMFFQPQADLIDGKTCSAEALVRWQHPERGLVPPSDFLPFAEESGLILDLDKVAARKTFEQLARLQKRGIALPISFNLSAQSLCDVSTIDFLRDLLIEIPVLPASVGVEITETSLMRDVAVSQQVIEALKAMGFHISIDDFGSGYSSMAYLLRYPSNFLKIDREFIKDISLGGTHRTMVKNLIGLAHGLGIGVVAEGVESEFEAKLLKSFGCDVAQGYYFSRPLSPEAFEEWVEKKELSSLASTIR